MAKTKAQKQEEARLRKHEAFVTHTLTYVMLYHPAGEWARLEGFELRPWYDAIKKAVRQAREIDCTLAGEMLAYDTAGDWTVEEWMSWFLAEGNFKLFYADVKSVHEQYGYRYYSMFPKKESFNFADARRGMIPAVSAWLVRQQESLAAGNDFAHGLRMALVS